MCLFLLALLGSVPGAVLTAQAPLVPDTTSAALTRQLDEVRQATDRFRDPQAAQRAGYRRSRLPTHPLLGERWFLRLTSRQQARLDLRRPSALYYALANGERVLTGVEYEVLLHSRDPVPEGFAGAGDRWRVEERFGPRRGLPLNPAMREALAEERRGRSGWGNAYGQVARLRTWIGIPNPDGIFAEQHRALPYLRVGLPASFADRGDQDAANGTALLMEGACKAEAGAFRSLVPDATRAQLQILANACQSAVTRLQTARNSTTSPDVFNLAAASTWREYNQAIYATLTAQQRVRVEVLLGPGGLLNPRIP